MKWIKFEDKLPTTEENKQVNILLGRPGWAAFFVGMYTHREKYLLKDRIASYNIETDRYIEWDTMMPTHYTITNLPEED